MSAEFVLTDRAGYLSHVAKFNGKVAFRQVHPDRRGLVRKMVADGVLVMDDKGMLSTGAMGDDGAAGNAELVTKRGSRISDEDAADYLAAFMGGSRTASTLLGLYRAGYLEFTPSALGKEYGVKL